MFYLLLIGSIAFMFLMWLVRSMPCPDCGVRLPTLLSPFRKTGRMWLAGGSLCAKCGCETNVMGRKVAAGQSLSPLLVALVIAAGVALPAGVGAVGFLAASRAAVASPQPVVQPNGPDN